jgi:hypothetical protein
MLYGSKQAAALWYKLLDAFLKKLGFVSSFLDPCFYWRPITDNSHDSTLAQSDALIILNVDDMRVAASPAILKDIHDRLYSEFQITTSDTGRFLGMDTEYDIARGVLKIHMGTYIETTVARFRSFDITSGVPFRELVGCLLWIVLNILGPELLRIKDLAKRSNDYTSTDYADALKVLDQISIRRHYGIIFKRGGAGREYVPSSSRPEGDLDNDGVNNGNGKYDPAVHDGVNNGNGEYDPAVLPLLFAAQKTSIYSIGEEMDFNELEEKDMYKLDLLVDDCRMDIVKTLKPTNKRFTLVAYSDASFATGQYA